MPSREQLRATSRAKYKVMYDTRYTKYNTLKMHPCMDCGFIPKVPYQMHFDHRAPTEKKFTIARMVTRTPWEVLLAEVAKCDLVCANCHALRTDLGWKNGTYKKNQPRA